MKKITFLVAALCATMFVSAETFTIKFLSTDGNDASAVVENISDFIGDGADLVKSFTASRIYNGKNGFGIKGGASGAKGELTLKLKQSYTITKITANVATYNTDGTTLLINGKEVVLSGVSALTPKEIEFDNAVTDSIMLASKNASKNRWYCESITVTYTPAAGGEGGEGDTPSAIDNVTVEGLYTEAGRVVCNEEFKIFTITGIDVTRQNGNLKGVYVVKTANATQKVVL